MFYHNNNQISLGLPTSLFTSSVSPSTLEVGARRKTSTRRLTKIVPMGGSCSINRRLVGGLTMVGVATRRSTGILGRVFYRSPNI